MLNWLANQNKHEMRLRCPMTRRVSCILLYAIDIS
jgi:hypothetical protein